MLKVYGLELSGNCYKVKLLLHLLDKEYQWIEVNSRKGETRTPEYLTKNPNGKIPLLELNDGSLLPESGAIMFYLSQNSELLPKDSFKLSQVLQWMFFEQASHQPYIAINRGIIHIRKQKEQMLDKVEENKVGGYKALDVMEKHLTDKNYFVGETLTIADIALFAYTHVAEQGEFDLSKYTNILRWIENVKAQPRFVEMKS